MIQNYKTLWKFFIVNEIMWKLLWFGSANSEKQIPHLTNIWFVLFADNVSQFLIGALSFLTFAIGPELTHFRLQLTFTLVLTAVTFKFVVNQNLPNIPYLTYLVSMSALVTSITFNILAILWISLEHNFMYWYLKVILKQFSSHDFCMRYKIETSTWYKINHFVPCLGQLSCK